MASLSSLTKESCRIPVCPLLAVGKDDMCSSQERGPHDILMEEAES